MLSHVIFIGMKVFGIMLLASTSDLMSKMSVRLINMAAGILMLDQTVRTPTTGIVTKIEALMPLTLLISQTFSNRIIHGLGRIGIGYLTRLWKGM